jgi:hypothetical protein
MLAWLIWSVSLTLTAGLLPGTEAGMEVEGCSLVSLEVRVDLQHSIPAEPSIRSI